MNVRGPWIEHLMEDEGLTYPQASDQISYYECIPYVENGEHMATLLKKNAEVHFAIYRKYRHKGYVTTRRIRQFLLPILEREGFLVTKLGPKDDDRFILKLGFELIGTSGEVKHYLMTSIKFLEKRHADQA